MCLLGVPGMASGCLAAHLAPFELTTCSALSHSLSKYDPAELDSATPQLASS